MWAGKKWWHEIVGRAQEPVPFVRAVEIMDGLGPLSGWILDVVTFIEHYAVPRNLLTWSSARARSNFIAEAPRGPEKVAAEHSALVVVRRVLVTTGRSKLYLQGNFI